MKAKGKKVSINPVRPDKGNFVVKTEKKTVVSLIGLARPFPKLKALDMDQLAWGRPLTPPTRTLITPVHLFLVSSPYAAVGAWAFVCASKLQV